MSDKSWETGMSQCLNVLNNFCFHVKAQKCLFGMLSHVVPCRELIPPITAFLEEDLKLVHTGGNLTPGDGVGSRRSLKTPTQKLTVVKPPCYLPTRVT